MIKLTSDFKCLTQPIESLSKYMKPKKSGISGKKHSLQSFLSRIIQKEKWENQDNKISKIKLICKEVEVGPKNAQYVQNRILIDR